MDRVLDTTALKAAAASAALQHVRGHALFGVGHGSTVAAFIQALADAGPVAGAVVAASGTSERLLREHGIAVVALEEVARIPVYVDGCDEVDPLLRLLKGAGGAHTREKLTAMAADTFVCIADETKFVDTLGRGPVAVEIDRRALAAAGEALRGFGGEPTVRRGFETEAGNVIVDVSGLDVAADPLALERAIDALPGVVECGIFAARPADLLVLGTSDGVRTIRPSDANSPDPV